MLVPLDKLDDRQNWIAITQRLEDLLDLLDLMDKGDSDCAAHAQAALHSALKVVRGRFGQTPLPIKASSSQQIVIWQESRPGGRSA